MAQAAQQARRSIAGLESSQAFLYTLHLDRVASVRQGLESYDSVCLAINLYMQPVVHASYDLLLIVLDNQVRGILANLITYSRLDLSGSSSSSSSRRGVPWTS